MVNQKNTDSGAQHDPTGECDVEEHQATAVSAHDVGERGDARKCGLADSDSELPSW